jgi:hypothetical protein
MNPLEELAAIAPFPCLAHHEVGISGLPLESGTRGQFRGVGVEPEFGIDLLHVNLFAASLLQGIVDDAYVILIKIWNCCHGDRCHSLSKIFSALFACDWQILID